MIGCKDLTCTLKFLSIYMGARRQMQGDALDFKIFSLPVVPPGWRDLGFGGSEPQFAAMSLIAKLLWPLLFLKITVTRRLCNFFNMNEFNITV